MTTPDPTKPQAVVVLPIEEVARRTALDTDLAAPALNADTRRAIAAADPTVAETDPTGVDLRRVHCGPDQARELLEYFQHVSAALQLRGDYERSTACAQAAESIRRTLEGSVAT